MHIQNGLLSLFTLLDVAACEDYLGGFEIGTAIYVSGDL